ncbi:hypothetical protein PIB30_055592 [Stylosanthes scabra]|uniref:Uncharacterized protein n=1 Tax=Stylosanthes scabra TaxID=79078 RepID=A0ABU6UM58_9FABA|nr:hypothetical protein [Stylosanthes scabra]
MESSDPPYQQHAPQNNVYQSNAFGDAYYGYEDPPPPYPPSQIGIGEAFQLLCQQRKELRENQSLNHDKVHKCIEKDEDENEDQEAEDVDQQVEDKDKEPKGMEIVHSTSSEATPPKLSSELHFEWVNSSDMNFRGPQHYGLLEIDGQLKAFYGVLDKKEVDVGWLNDSRCIMGGVLKLEA